MSIVSFRSRKHYAIWEFQTHKKFYPNYKVISIVGALIAPGLIASILCKIQGRPVETAQKLATKSSHFAP